MTADRVSEEEVERAISAWRKKGQSWQVDADLARLLALVAAERSAREAEIEQMKATIDDLLSAPVRCVHRFEENFAMNDSFIRYCVHCGISEGCER